jgi:hypothetical protein
VQGAVEHLGGRELHLQDRDVVAVAGLAVCAGERVRTIPCSYCKPGTNTLRYIRSIPSTVSWT